jgi:alanine-glyoxylate transaminase/serine-glyoxylate transaminase/serine-pyruvate transaminase
MSNSVSNSQAGYYFLQVPGPTVVPDEVVAAMSQPMMDHRGPVFAKLAVEAAQNLKPIFKTKQPVMVIPASGTGAWHASIANCLSKGDKVLIPEVGMFSTLWGKVSRELGLEVIEIAGDWRSGIDAQKVEDALRADSAGEIKAVFATHNETSTGVTSDIAAVRAALNAANHDALLFVDTVSSLVAMDYDHDGWGVDIAICGSQKGLMLPPGLAFAAVSEKALEAKKSSDLNPGYFEFDPLISATETGLYPYTPPVSLIYGLKKATEMILDEGLDAIYARHAKLGDATRACVNVWGLETQCQVEGQHSNAVTAVRVPEGINADEMRAFIFDKYNLSLAAGLGKIAGEVFRIGHLGYQNPLTLMGALSGVEMGMEAFGIKFNKGGVNAAMDILSK